VAIRQDNSEISLTMKAFDIEPFASDMFNSLEIRRKHQAIGLTCFAIAIYSSNIDT